MNRMKQHLWWQRGIIYQIYPRSFQDSNGDGIGDLAGITQRLDYLKWLGVDAVWLSPVYPSPMADFGYDISDYRNIHSIFGTIDDFDKLLNEVHRRDIKLILDLVPNHTSDQHPWFLESRSSKTNSKRDWYIWRDAQSDGSPPNNWLSAFGGSAWEWDQKTNQYYYHAFDKAQPDLNWRNKNVQEEIFNIMRFWLDKGVDGFRVDVMWHLIKDEQFRDNPPNPDYKQERASYEKLLPTYSTDQPEVHEIVQRMRDVLNEYNERVMIAEIYLPIQRLVVYYGIDNNGAHLPFNFLLITTTWNAETIASAIDQYEGALPKDSWPNWVLGNHDNSRIASRVGLHQARVAAMLLLTLRGTPTIYYGDEIGMRDVPIPSDEVQDPVGLNMPEKNLSRDPERTPMQWDDSENAGFTHGKPWLRIDKTYRRVNVKVQQEKPHSMLMMHKRLIQLRKSEPSLSVGRYERIYSDNKMIVYLREEKGHPRFLIALNFSHRPSYFRAQEEPFAGIIEISTSPELEGTEIGNHINLSGDEGIIVRLRN